MLDHVSALLRHYRRGLGNHHYDQEGNKDERIAQGHSHECSPWTTRVRPLTRSMCARWPAAMAVFPPLTAFQELPQYSRRQVSPGLSSVGSTTDSPAGSCFIAGNLRRIRSFPRRRKVT